MGNPYSVTRLGPCRYTSPLDSGVYIDDRDRVLVDASAPARRAGATLPSFETAGPRKKIYFEPSSVRAAIVTCGGLCPGLNDVIRGLVMVLWHRYGVKDILGLRYGYEGLAPAFDHEPLSLTPDTVDDIHQDGGTILGTSRGKQDTGVMTDFLVQSRINILFAIGGDGTQRGALAIAAELQRRKHPVAVVGIPKTIDNDLAFTDRTFGFATAIETSLPIITGAHMEAKGVRNGVGLVKLMGRESGFVAVHAAMASSDVNLVLVRESPFKIEKVLRFLEVRLNRKSHAVIVIAEGAGPQYVGERGVDASGNRQFGDIGLFIKSAIEEHFTKQGQDVKVRYIDPSYTVRSVPANADDSVFCFLLSGHAVHAAMAGRTACVVSQWNSRFVHVPTALAVSERKTVDPGGLLWQSVLDCTGQPRNLS